MAKLQPAVKTYQFEILEENYAYIDISQCASMLNRRFYPQGLLWAVGGFTVINRAGAGENKRILIEKLPETWVMNNAWTKGFKLWQRMIRQARSESQSIDPKFLDFKVYMDSVHHADGSDLNQTPVAYNAELYRRGQWDYSSYIFPDTSDPGNSDEVDIICIGANFPGAGASGNNAVSLIEGYAAGRALPYESDPNMPDDAASAYSFNPQNWGQAIFNDGTDQDAAVIQQTLLADNTSAPYPFENGPDQDNPGVPFTDTQYPGGANNPVNGGTLEVHDFVDITGTTVGARTMLRGGTFPCGLLKVSNNATSTVDLLIHMVPGHYRGYLAEPMQDV